MKVVRTVAGLRKALAPHRRRGRSIGFVPTMGALHAGHAALVARAARETDVVVASVFVNPLQFGPKEDFAGYPRTFARDLRLLRRAGADVVFAPAVAEMYRPDADTTVDQTRLVRPLCGPFRPGHFRGVQTVVAKLFNRVQPDAAFFGLKDYQQVRVIERMARDLDWPIRIVRCPTVREPDGLALSSRNAYLSSDQRRQALGLVAALRRGRKMIRAGERRAVRIAAAMRTEILARSPGARIDYAAVADPVTLEPVKRIRGRTLLALAVRIGKTRLIDNAVVSP